MNVKATLSPEDVARACADAMWKEDDASSGLGMIIVGSFPAVARAETFQDFWVGLVAEELDGAVCQQEILQEAGVLWDGQSRKRIETVAEFCPIALEGEFAALDSRFGKCDPSLQRRLEAYLSNHQSSFVVVE